MMRHATISDVFTSTQRHGHGSMTIRGWMTVCLSSNPPPEHFRTLSSSCFG